MSWLRRIVTIQEKKQFHPHVLLLFSGFVGLVRLFGEWFLGGVDVELPLVHGLGFAAFYWSCFFVYGTVMSTLLGEDWRRCVNVVLVGIFLGVLPPLVDTIWYGLGKFSYSYVFNFPKGWPWLLFSPATGMPLGECVVLWTTVVVCVAYAWVKRPTVGRVALVAVLAYFAAVFNGGVVPTVARAIVDRAGWAGGHLWVVLTLLQVLVALVLWLRFQPSFAKHLVKRLLHAAPFVAMACVGASLVGPLSVNVPIYGGGLALLFAVALTQNDHHDRSEDEAVGRLFVVGGAEVAMMNITAGWVCLVLCIAGSIVGFILTVVWIVSFLYSYPFYRAKRYFPSNLKIEGVWGLSAFMVGVVAQLEHFGGGQPSWSLTGARQALKLPLDWTIVIAAALAFGGHTLVAIAKDWKDVEGDLQVGNQTVFTLAHRRGWDVRRIRWLTTVAVSACLALPWLLLAFAGRLPWAATLLGGLFVGWAISTQKSEHSASDFRKLLLCATFMLATLATLLHFGVAG